MFKRKCRSHLHNRLCPSLFDLDSCCEATHGLTVSWDGKTEPEVVELWSGLITENLRVNIKKKLLVTVPWMQLGAEEPWAGKTRHSRWITWTLSLAYMAWQKIYFSYYVSKLCVLQVHRFSDLVELSCGECCIWHVFIRDMEKEMATHSSTLAWKIPWTEEPCRLPDMGSRRVKHDWATSLSLFTFMHWRRKWQPTPVFLPGESQGRGSLVGCRLWGHTESDMTEVT